MKLKLFLPACDSGFTLIEFMVASLLGLLVMGLCLNSVITNRNVYKHDIVSTRTNQNLRSAMDIIGMNVRQTGEALDQYFPALQITNGTSGAQDQLILRRNLFENEILNVCQNLTAGTSNTSVIFAYNTMSSACAYSTTLQPYLATWNNYRTQQGGTVRAYIYNRSTKQGEFFVVTGGTDTGTVMSLSKTNVPWQYSYNGDGSSAGMYLLEEYRFQVQNGVLQLVQNADAANTLNVVDGINGFQITARMQDGTAQSTFGTTDSWIGLASLEITMNGSDTFAGDTITSSLTSRLFPRNILSH